MSAAPGRKRGTRCLFRPPGRIAPRCHRTLCRDMALPHVILLAGVLVEVAGTSTESTAATGTGLRMGASAASNATTPPSRPPPPTAPSAEAVSCLPGPPNPLPPIFQPCSHCGMAEIPPWGLCSWFPFEALPSHSGCRSSDTSSIPAVSGWGGPLPMNKSTGTPGLPGSGKLPSADGSPHLQPSLGYRMWGGLWGVARAFPGRSHLLTWARAARAPHVLIELLCVRWGQASPQAGGWGACGVPGQEDWPSLCCREPLGGCLALPGDTLHQLWPHPLRGHVLLPQAHQ
ncbi:uncharacterized protein C1orf159 homolog isoform X1 [Elephas maximus indicus]|uniref:uncharacterized protein C1orf159 homolog isoform X1 n=1 Tax=Elephas maximus indicus TaxID=99487 RepID=UPI002116AD5D|nr:uncharacterized protein C1orf159 homolog isoform X1 [Elephas maximus indicus]